MEGAILATTSKPRAQLPATFSVEVGHDEYSLAFPSDPPAGVVPPLPARCQRCSRKRFVDPSMGAKNAAGHRRSRIVRVNVVA